MPFGGVGSGWVYDVNSSAFGWGINGQNVIKMNTNVSDGDWSIAKIYSNIATQWLVDPTQVHKHTGGANGISFVVRNGITYLATTHGEKKQVYKYVIVESTTAQRSTMHLLEETGWVEHPINIFSKRRLCVLPFLLMLTYTQH